MTGKVVNLRQKRKQLARDEKRKVAGVSSVVHGLSKAQKDLQKTQGLKAARMLDGHKRDV